MEKNQRLLLFQFLCLETTILCIEKCQLPLNLNKKNKMENYTMPFASLISSVPLYEVSNKIRNFFFKMEKRAAYAVVTDAI